MSICAKWRLVPDEATPSTKSSEPDFTVPDNWQSQVLMQIVHLNVERKEIKWLRTEFK